MHIYIGNLSYNISDEQLKEVFEKFGEVVAVKIITDRETGRSKGFGFVEMRNDSEAQTAIAELNDTEIEGRTANVNKARPKRSAKNQEERKRYNRR